MAMSEITLCNTSLAHLGMKPITSAELTANTRPEAIAFNTYLAIVRDDLFREHKWPFASVTHQLTQYIGLDENNAPGWDYFYTYPVTALTVWAVYNDATSNDIDNQDFQKLYMATLSTACLVSNLDEAWADCTFERTDPNTWDTKFILAITYRLAAMMSPMLTGDDEKGLKLGQLSNLAMWEAKRIAASEKRKKPDQNSSYQDSRGT